MAKSEESADKQLQLMNTEVYSIKVPKGYQRQGNQRPTPFTGSSRPIVCYTAVFSVVTQRSSPLTAAENRTTFLSLD